MANNKENRLNKIQSIDNTFTKSTYNKIMVISLIAVFAIGVGFQLTDNPDFSSGNTAFTEIIQFLTSIFWPPFILAPVALCFYVVPDIILSLKTNKYEEKKIEDVSTYIEQMLYSFKKNSKILSSLIDALGVFPDGEMKDCIEQAINYIQTTQTSGNIYKEALQIIENKFSCRRIRSLHRYLIKVEGVGGQFGMGLQTLLNDRRLWVERIDDFKKEKNATIRDILVATAFSTIIIIITLAMLPSQYGAATSVLVRSCSVVYMMVSMLNIKATYKRTILYVNDIENREHEKRMARKLIQYRNYNIKEEKRKAFKVVLIFLAIGIIGTVSMILMKNTGMLIPIIAICVCASIFAYFIQPPMKYSSMRKSLVNEIEKTFPDWLLELSLLLNTKNLHVAIEETTKTAPLVIKRELKTLIEEIKNDPTSMEPFTNFLNDVPVPSIHSSMKLLYSIGEYGASEEADQLGEIIQRNATLMNKAEIRKNNERLAKVFMMKFIPMGASALKMIVDMFAFILIFLGEALTI